MVDKKTIELTHQFCCQTRMQYGYQQLYLIGSRARGDYKPTSDHDFVAVLDDDVPREILSCTKLQFDFAAFTHENGLGKVDLLFATKSRVAMLNPTPDDLIPYSCQRDGKQMWKRN